ncbi:TauD/TfdA family dioxygenase [Saccharothrix syringae]|nr:TauD/TfdA family dioxygenase [Saccharothrix syringae]
MSTTDTAVPGTPDCFDPVRVPVSGPLEDFLTRPGTGGTDTAAARDRLADLVARHLLGEPGALVLTGLPTEPGAARRAVLRVTGLLGSALPQNREGELVREVRDRGTAIGEGSRARYSDSRLGGSPHTDGAEAPLPAPDVFTLFCVRQSERGGALRLVHVRDLVRELSGHPDLLAVLREPFHFDRRGDQGPDEPPTTAKPVLFEQRGRPAVTYLRSYVEKGHAHPHVPPLSREQVAALDLLDRVVESDRIARSGKLREGELALFDNLSLLHGRTEFEDESGHPRLLLRTWVRLDDALYG